MSKEWILNSATNRFQLNYKRSVGPTSESIRACSPQSKEEWADYYYSKVRSKEYIDDLGKKLFVKITEVIQAEVEDLTEEDCVSYMHNLVIDRTYDGYIREINTIYGQLEKLLNVKIQPSSDEWDRKYNVDFFIEVNGCFIGLQIKPVSKGIQLPQIFKEHSIQNDAFDRFTKKYGGKVFYVFSSGSGKDKSIQNEDVVEEIKAEINRLSLLN